METLKGIIREQSGTRAARRLRAGGMVPGIVYGHGKANVPFVTSAHDLELVLAHGEHLVEMELGGKLPENMKAFHDASAEGRHIELESTCSQPAPLPLGLEEWTIDE